MADETPQLNIMTKFRIEEVSGVDRPAQPGARAVLMKRSDHPKPMHPKKGESRDAFTSRFMADKAMQGQHPDPKARHKAAGQVFGGHLGKNMQDPKLTTDAEGHSHLLDATERSGFTTHDQSAGSEFGHSHPYIVEADGTVAIGMADGHTHGIQSISKTGGSTAGGTNDSMEDNMATDAPKAADGNTPTVDSKDLEKAQATASYFKNLAGLNADQRAYADGLADDDERTEFMAKADADRAELVTKAAGPDPVIYTDEAGNEYFKSDDPRLVSSAKRADRSDRLAKAERERTQKATYAKRIGDELGNHAGDDTAKTALLKAVDSIEDEDLRTGALAIVKAGNDNLAKAFKRAGTSGGANLSVDGENDPEEKLDNLAKAFAKANKVDYATAYDNVLQTDEGAALYAETVDE